MSTPGRAVESSVAAGAPPSMVRRSENKQTHTRVQASVAASAPPRMSGRTATAASIGRHQPAASILQRTGAPASIGRHQPATTSIGQRTAATG